MPVPCATNSCFGGINLSDGVMTNATYRSRHVAARAITSIALTYLNGVGTAENGTAPVTHKCAIEYNGVVTPLYFAASRTVVVATGARATTDFAAVAIPAGATFWVRTWVSVGAGGRWGNTATMNRTPAPPYGDGITVGADVVDATGLLAAGANNSALVLPLAIMGNEATDLPSVIIFGDSIPTGGSDIQDGVYDLGYLVRALNRTPTGVGIPYINTALGGETVNGFISGASGINRKALPTIMTIRDAIVAYGTNDLLALGRTAAQIIADLQTFYTSLAVQGMRVWGVTLLPRTTSTDSWATTGNQTPMAGYAPAGIRSVVNAWIRSMPVPLAGVIDAADAVETARDSGFWKVNTVANYMTVDGTHPTSAASKLMAGMVPVSRLVRATPAQVLA